MEGWPYIVCAVKMKRIIYQRRYIFPILKRKTQGIANRGGRLFFLPIVISLIILIGGSFSFPEAAAQDRTGATSDLPYGLFDLQADWGTESSPPQKGLYKIEGTVEQLRIEPKELVILQGNGNSVGMDRYRNTGSEQSKSDEGFFLYTEREGNWSIQSKVQWTDINQVSDWGKAGVMIRELAQDAQSKFFMASLCKIPPGFVSRSTLFFTEWRDEWGDISRNRGIYSNHNESREGYIYLRINRISSKNLFFSEWSYSGRDWVFGKHIDFPMQKKVGYGLCVTSGSDDNKLCEAQFSDVVLSHPIPTAFRTIGEVSPNTPSKLEVSIEVINSYPDAVKQNIEEILPKEATFIGASHDGRYISSQEESHSIVWNQTFPPGSTTLTYNINMLSDKFILAKFQGKIGPLEIFGDRYYDFTPAFSNSVESEFVDFPPILEHILNIPDDVGKTIPAQYVIESGSPSNVIRYFGKRFFVYSQKRGSQSLSGRITILDCGEGYLTNANVGGMIWNQGTLDNQYRYGIRFNARGDFCEVRLNIMYPDQYEEISQDFFLAPECAKPNNDRSKPYDQYYDTLHFEINRIAEENIFYGKWSLDGTHWEYTTPKQLAMQDSVAYGLYIRNDERSVQPIHAELKELELKPLRKPYCLRSFKPALFEYNKELTVFLQLKHSNPNLSTSSEIDKEGGNRAAVSIEEMVPDRCMVTEISHGGKRVDNRIVWHFDQYPGDLTLTYTLIPIFEQNGSLSFKGNINSIPIMGKIQIHPLWRQTELEHSPVWRTWTQKDGIQVDPISSLHLVNDRLSIQYRNNDGITIMNGYEIQSAKEPIPFQNTIHSPTTSLKHRTWLAEQQFFNGINVIYFVDADSPHLWISNIIDPVHSGLFESQNDYFDFITYLQLNENMSPGDNPKFFLNQDGNIWITCVGGIIHLNLSKGSFSHNFNQIQTYLFDPDYSIFYMNSFFEVSDNHLVGNALYFDPEHMYRKDWILAEFRDQKWNLLYRTQDNQNLITGFLNKDNEIMVLQESDARELSLVKAEKNSAIKYPLPSTIGNSFEVLQTGDRDSFWIGTSNGVARYAKPLWHPPLEVAHVDEMILSIQEDSSDRLWFLTPTRLIECNDGQWNEYLIPEPFVVNLNSPQAMFALSDNRVIIDGNNLPSLLVFHSDTHTFSQIEHPLGKPVKILGETGGDFVWVGCSDGKGGMILEQFDGKQFTRFHPGEITLPPNAIFVTQSSPEQLVIATQTELKRIAISAETIQAETMHSFNEINDILYKNPKEIWVADRNQIILINEQKASLYHEHHSPIHSMCLDDGDFWVATGSGFLASRNGIWMGWGEEDGLPSNHIVSLYIDRQGRHWAGTDEGISLYDPNVDQEPPITTMDSSKNSQQIAPFANATFVVNGKDKWKQTESDRLLFSYKLNSEPWSNYSESNTISFSNLYGGDYRLHVKAMDRNWNMDPTPFIFSFRVLPPWYLQPLAVILFWIIIFLIFCIVSIHFYHHSNLHNLVEKRTQDLYQKNVDLIAEKEARIKIEKEMQYISERERIRIGQDIHDGVIQQLAGVKLMGDMVAEYSEPQSDGGNNPIHRMNAIIGYSIQQLRGLSKGLFPVELHKNGLRGALKELSSNVNELHPIQCTVECAKIFPAADEIVNINLFRIVQEALNNAVKYSKANHIKLRIHECGNSHCVSVEDDGTGFNPDTVDSNQSQGMGLKIMNYRADIINAKLTITSQPGKGTTVQCTIPTDNLRKTT